MTEGINPGWYKCVFPSLHPEHEEFHMFNRLKGKTSRKWFIFELVTLSPEPRDTERLWGCESRVKGFGLYRTQHFLSRCCSVTRPYVQQTAAWHEANCDANRLNVCCTADSCQPARHRRNRAHSLLILNSSCHQVTRLECLKEQSVCRLLGSDNILVPPNMLVVSLQVGRLFTF